MTSDSRRSLEDDPDLVPGAREEVLCGAQDVADEVEASRLPVEHILHAEGAQTTWLACDTALPSPPPRVRYTIMYIVYVYMEDGVQAEHTAVHTVDDVLLHQQVKLDKESKLQRN